MYSFTEAAGDDDNDDATWQLLQLRKSILKCDELILKSSIFKLFKIFLRNCEKTFNRILKKHLIN